MKRNTRQGVFSIAALVAAGLAIYNRLPAHVVAQPEGPRIAYYQDSMHPWVKANKPGKCTICQMELTPVTEGAPSQT